MIKSIKSSKQRIHAPNTYLPKNEKGGRKSSPKDSYIIIIDKNKFKQPQLIYFKLDRVYCAYNKLYTVKKKIQAIDYIKYKNNSKLLLWQRDGKAGEKWKRYIVATAKDIYKVLMDVKGKYRCVYESWLPDQPIYFAIDLDIKCKKNRDRVKKYIKETINKVIKVAKKELGEIVTNKDFIITKSPPKPEKDSYHIIMRTSKPFANISHCKAFYNKLQEYEYDEEIDGSIYNNGCLRTCYSTKSGQKRHLMPFTEMKHYLLPKDYSSDRKYWLDTLITYVRGDSHDCIKLDISEINCKKTIENNIKVYPYIYLKEYIMKTILFSKVIKYLDYNFSSEYNFDIIYGNDLEIFNDTNKINIQLNNNNIVNVNINTKQYFWLQCDDLYNNMLCTNSTNELNSLCDKIFKKLCTINGSRVKEYSKYQKKNILNTIKTNISKYITIFNTYVGQIKKIHDFVFILTGHKYKYKIDSMISYFNNKIKYNIINTNCKKFKSKCKDTNVPGYLYCLYNKVYDTYGNSVYKLGKSINVKRRLGSYSTSYLNPSELKYTSQKVKYYSYAEKLLFLKLKKYKLRSNREFFDCELAIIIKNIDETVKFINNNSKTEILNTLNKSSKYNKIDLIFDLFNNALNEYTTTKTIYILNNKIKCKESKIVLQDKWVTDILEQEIVRNNYNITEKTVINRMFQIFKKDETDYLEFLNEYKPNKYNRQKFKNLLEYITICQLQSHNNKNDFKEVVAIDTVKYNDLDMLLRWCGINTLFFDKSITVIDKSLSNDIIKEININKRRLRNTYGDIMRIREGFDKLKVFNLLTRFINIYFGININKTTNKRIKIDNKRVRVSIYTIDIPLLEWLIVRISRKPQNYNKNKTEDLINYIKDNYKETTFVYGNLHGYSGLLIDILEYNINKKNKNNINMFNYEYLN